MTEFSFAVKGAAELQKAFAALAATVDVSGREIVSLAAARVVADAQHNFSGAHRKHQPHVTAGSTAFGPMPNVVTGTLRRSIRGDGIRRDAVGSYTTTVGPRTVYARRVELGLAPTGAYPYFGPAVSKNRKLITGIAVGQWANALRT